MLNVKYNRQQGSFYPFTFLLFYLFTFLPLKLLLSFLVLAENLDFLHQWCDGINTLAVSGKVVEGEVYIEEIFPLMSDDGQRLNLGQVHIVEAQDGEHLGERSLVVGKAEDDACLVGHTSRLHKLSRWQPIPLPDAWQ